MKGIMTSQVFYRKWRAGTFSGIVGQTPVTQTLLNALKTERISHAYLFYGPRGTGKTSTARVLAKAVNCISRKENGEPCNECIICQSIQENRSLDIIEIDAASNTGVDDIRNLRDRVGISPSQAKYKVYIIDEFHMLSTAASNALLKTLEEPPPHVIFILATTEVHKILPTIMSRCQRFDFKRISLLDIVNKLAEICTAENINIEDEGLGIVAKSASGSLRDAENLLQQLTTYFGENITVNQIKEMLGMQNNDLVRKFVRQIIENDTNAAINTINDGNKSGLDLRDFKRETVNYLRSLMIVSSGLQDSIEIDRNDLEELKSLAQLTPLNKILLMLKTFSRVEIDSDIQSILSFELAVIDIINSGTTNNNAINTTSRIETAVVNPVQKRSLPKPQQPVKQNAETAGPHGAQNKHAAFKQETVKHDKPEPPKTFAENSPFSADNMSERIKQEWRNIMEQVSPDMRRSPAMAIMRSAGVQPVSMNKDIIVLSFRYGYLKDKMEEPENKLIAEKILSSFMGTACKIECILENNNLVKEALKLGAEIIEVEES